MKTCSWRENQHIAVFVRSNKSLFMLRNDKGVCLVKVFITLTFLQNHAKEKWREAGCCIQARKKRKVTWDNNCLIVAGIN